METIEHQEHKTPKQVPWMGSCRLTFMLMGMSCMMCLYMLESNMGVAIVCMVNDTRSTSPDTDNSSATPSSISHNFSLFYAKEQYEGGNTRNGEFDWDSKLRGWVLSSYYVGYIMTQIPGGWLANKYGAKIIIGSGFASFSVLTLLTPVAAQASVYLLMAMQAIKGFAGGFIFPALWQMCGKWTTDSDRTTIVGVCLAGLSVGKVISSSVSGLLCERGFAGGWPSIFYVFGNIGLVFCMIWYFLAFSSPSDHPRISEAELRYVNTSGSNDNEIKTLDVPWKSLLSTLPLYALYLSDFCYMWCWYVALTSLPQYMNDVLEFEIEANGLYSSLPYITNIIVIFIGSPLADFLLNRRILSRTHTRKLFNTLTLLPGAGFCIGLAYLTSQQAMLAVALLTLWLGAMGFNPSGLPAAMIDMAPRFSGIIMGIDNTLGTVPGIIAPVIIGELTENGTPEEWQLVFFISAGISVVGCLSFVLFATAEEQEWARSTPHEVTIDWPPNNESIDNPSIIGQSGMINVPSNAKGKETATPVGFETCKF